jgi:uncharacterized membrane protein YhhN
MPATLFDIATTLAAGGAVATVACETRRRLPVFYLFKPLTTVLIVVAFVAQAPGVSGVARGCALFALSASLTGDIALMFDETRAFIIGLLAFLCAHLAFVAGLLWNLPRFALGAPAMLGPAVAIAMLALLWRRVGALRPAVTAYAAVLTAMWLAAEARWTAVGDRPALLALSGASLFMLSDGLLAWDRFGRRFAFAQALVLVTYFPALWLLACSGAY